MEPYLIKKEEVVLRFKNPGHNDFAICVCGHRYFRHFDDSSIDAPAPSCKHCPDCTEFRSLLRVADTFGFEDETSWEDVNAGKPMHQLALEFAARAHSGAVTGRMQLRKYTADPYIVHPIEVAKILQRHGLGDETTLAIAFLHDVVEDCGVRLETVFDVFGHDVGEGVRFTTDISTKADGNRAIRKAKDLQHYASGDWRSQSVKVADLLSNTRTIVPLDMDFATVYIPEKRRMVDALTLAHPSLLAEARAVIADSIVALDSAGKRIRC